MYEQLRGIKVDSTVLVGVGTKYKVSALTLLGDDVKVIKE
jgi:hypothetical protein